MLTISKPLSASQAKAYHKEEFANAQGNYYTEDDHVRGEWHGKLAEQLACVARLFQLGRNRIEFAVQTATDVVHHSDNRD